MSRFCNDKCVCAPTQTFTPAKDTRPPATPSSQPTWLDASQTAVTTCYTDAYAAAH